MGNHVFSDMVAPRITKLTINKVQLLGVFSKQFERDLTSGSKPMGDTERIKKPHRSLIRDGFAYVGQSIDRRYTTIVADQKFGTDLDWDSIEKAVEMERSAEELEENIFDPAAQQLSQEWDLRAGRFVKNNTNHVVGALGTTPTTLLTFTGARSRIIGAGGWETATRKGVFVTPDMMGTLIATNNNILALFNPKSDVEDAFREGFIGRYAGAKWFESMSLPTHTTGVITTQATGTTISGAGQTGSTLNLAGTTGDTLKAGDKITIASVNEVNPMTRQTLQRLMVFTVVNDATFAASAATVTISPQLIASGPYQNVDSVPANAAIVLLSPGTTMVDGAAKSGLYGAMFTNEAFGFVGVPLPMPAKGTQEYTDQYTDPKTGMSFGTWRHAEFQGRTFSNRIDTWGGFGNLQGENSSCLIASLN